MSPCSGLAVLHIYHGQLKPELNNATATSSATMVVALLLFTGAADPIYEDMPYTACIGCVCMCAACRRCV